MFRINQYLDGIKTQLLIITDLVSDYEALLMAPDSEVIEEKKSRINTIISHFSNTCSIAERLTECFTKLDPSDDDYDLNTNKQLFSELIEKLFAIYHFQLLHTDNCSCFYTFQKIEAILECARMFLQGFYFSEEEIEY